MRNNQIAAIAMGAYYLFVSPLVASFEIHLGPFNLEVTNSTNHRAVLLDDPIGYAIANQLLLEVTFESGEVISQSITKVLVKTILIQPYQFGINEMQNPVIRGNIISESSAKELRACKSMNERAFLMGVLKQINPQSETANVCKITGIQCLVDTHFETSKGIKTTFVDELPEILFSV